MSDNQKARVKEQAEAYVHRIRTAPRSVALSEMEDLLTELYKLRDVYSADFQCEEGCSCRKLK